MKKIKSVLLLFSICAVAFTSCKKGDDKPEEASAGMSAKVDGSAKVNTGPVTASIYQSENSMQIIGQFSTTEGISLLIQDIKVGNYDLSGELVFASYQNGADGITDGFLGTSGSVSITSITDDVVKGTFQFTAENLDGETKVISEGKFEAKVIKI